MEDGKINPDQILCRARKQYMKINGKLRVLGIIEGGNVQPDDFEKEFTEWLASKGLKFGGMITDEFEMNYDDELQRRRNEKK